MIRDVLPTGQEWQTPTFVVITWRDGTQEERPFATKVLAEAFVYSIPIMAVYEPDSEFADIVSAKIRPAHMSIN